MKRNNKIGFWKKFSKRLKLTLKNPFTYFFLLIVILLVAATFVVRNTEPYHPEGEVTNWKDAIWHSIVAVVAAYYDYYMKTVPGRLASLGLLLLGMAFWTIVMGKITESIMSVQTKKNKGLKKLKRMKGHFILCGWREDFEEILDSVINSNFDITPDMIVLVNNAPVEEMRQLMADIRFKEVKYINGDFSDAEVLQRAHIQTAKRVLVISDYTGGATEMEIDSRTVLSVMTMKNLNPKIYVAAELLSAKFQNQLKMANCDEVILTQEYQYSLLATASSGQGYSNVIKALISDDSDSGIIIEDIPNKFGGNKYEVLCKAYEAAERCGDILVGLLIKIEESAHPLLTPPADFIIPKGSKAIVIRAKDEADDE